MAASFENDAEATARALSDAAAALHERAWEEVAALEEAAKRVESAGGDPAAVTEVTRSLRRLSQDRRRALD